MADIHIYHQENTLMRFSSDTLHLDISTNKLRLNKYDNKNNISTQQ